MTPIAPPAKRGNPHFRLPAREGIPGTDRFQRPERCSTPRATAAAPGQPTVRGADSTSVREARCAGRFVRSGRAAKLVNGVACDRRPTRCWNSGRNCLKLNGPARRAGDPVAAATHRRRATLAASSRWRGPGGCGGVNRLRNRLCLAARRRAAARFSSGCPVVAGRARSKPVDRVSVFVLRVLELSPDLI